MVPAMNEDKKDVIVIGGGIAGVTAANALAAQGLEVALVERQANLGGHAASWACMATEQCNRCSACLVQERMAGASACPQVEVILGAEVSGCRGEAGDFQLELLPREGMAGGGSSGACRLLEAARRLSGRALVLATGFDPYDPSENPLLGYGHYAGVLTTRDVDDFLRRDDLPALLPPELAQPRLAFVQCVGSRDRQAGREYCSQFCCRTTIRLARRLLYLRPELEITIFYIDLQVMSKEFVAFYEQLRQQVSFVQGVPAEVSPGSQEGKLRVYGVRPGQVVTEQFEFDRIVLSIGLAPTESHRRLAEMLDLRLDEFGYFPTRSEVLTLETSRPGIYLAGACTGPADIQGSCKQALAVAGMVASQLESETSRSGGERPRRRATA